MTQLSRLLSAVAPPPTEGAEAAQRHLDGLTKPPRSLGRLEEIALRLALLRGRARVVVADLGVASPLHGSANLVARRIGPGTANIAAGPAMTREQAIRAIEAGATLAEEALDGGADLLATGEMGIGNTTVASAIAAAITGAAAERVTGRGTGVDDATLARKVAVVRQALEVNRPDAGDGLDVLAKVGGFEIGGLVGVILA